MRPLTILIFGLIYTTVYVALAFWPRGPGRYGSAFFLAPLLPWILILVALNLSTNLMDLRNRVYFVAVLFFHYFITFVSVLIGFGDRWEHYFAEYWKEHFIFALFTIGWYLLGQIFMWTAFFVNFENRKQY